MPSSPSIFGESLSSLSCLLSAPTCCSVASCHPSSAASASWHTTASLPAVPPPLLAPLPLVVPFFISGTVASCSTQLFFTSPFFATGTSPICWHHHLSLCNGLFLLLCPLVPLVPMAGCCVESNRHGYRLVLPIPNIPSHCANRLHIMSPPPAS